MSASVDTKHSQYDASTAIWAKCRDAVAGQEAVHAGGTKYLPKLAKQTDDEYKAMVGRTLYYNATGRTLDGMTGLIFRRPPTIEAQAELLEFMQKDADTTGTPLLAFCEKAVDELMQVGRLGLFADYPPTDGIRTQAQQKAAGARPFLRIYRAEEIINWRTARVNNQTVLSLVVLAETHEEVDGFGVKQTEQRRVLKLEQGFYTVEVWRKVKTADQKEDWQIVEAPMIPQQGGKPMGYIPFLICGPMGVDVNVAKPPMLDLVNVNLSHYRTTADYEHGLHFTGLPTPVVTGHQFGDNEEFALGSTVVKAFPNADAQAFFLEFQGTGLQQLSKRLEEKEAMMAALGARMLAAEKRQAETAETAAIHRSGENSVLASLANAAGQALTKALEWCSLYDGLTAEAKVELNTDYLPSGMTAQELTALVAAWQGGAISHLTLLDNLARGEIARQGVTPEQEIDEIKKEGPALGTMGGTGGTNNEVIVA